MIDKKNFEDEKKKSGDFGLGSNNDREKDAEIAYLEAQLRKKEEENKKLTKDLERVILEQKETLEKMRDADNAFIGQNSSQLNQYQDQIALLKRENQVMEFKLERAEKEAKQAV
jgi:chromosome segregation ATPase